MYDAFNTGARQTLASKTIVVPHTYDEAFIADALKLHPDATPYFGGSRAIHICYTGNLYGIRSAKLVSNVARRLRAGNPSREIIIHVSNAMSYFETFGPGEANISGPSQCCSLLRKQLVARRAV